ncbi:hypothetical protein K227x_07970 [Rubripirellula lacrimiformis]|uniref:Uncharacterized protein n=1 Tax=Rubripirellula lacrimiformis TaxID=1930273 RepID=A0A517N5N3_9BACT|nr:hypothetical protein K227x_07970 [Rubripirellula lacrimiformis]
MQDESVCGCHGGIEKKFEFKLEFKFEFKFEFKLDAAIRFGKLKLELELELELPSRPLDRRSPEFPFSP